MLTSSFQRLAGRPQIDPLITRGFPSILVLPQRVLVAVNACDRLLHCCQSEEMKNVVYLARHLPFPQLRPYQQQGHYLTARAMLCYPVSSAFTQRYCTYQTSKKDTSNTKCDGVFPSIGTLRRESDFIVGRVRGMMNSMHEPLSLTNLDHHAMRLLWTWNDQELISLFSTVLRWSGLLCEVGDFEDGTSTRHYIGVTRILEI
ncbi:uncharacterized protein ARMOST_02263 [Armillaria ostoyae]|uniref:Uncharacterized protein n=1 Tax=Armillaria ostoyae TaxID=47428 RepID=A0A284QR85_ARMOS|nr:uncharacterized protein ARMOST_02263 [Armillaria ostoyae]